MLRTSVRLTVWLIIVVTLAATGLGLLNARRGLPLTSLAGVRELPLLVGEGAREYLDPGYARRLGAADGGAATNNRRLQALRAAIGCEQPGDGASRQPGLLRSAYRWRDTDDVANFADTAPANVVAEHPLRRESDFVINVSVEGAVMPTQLEGQIRAGAQRAYEHWRDWLGTDDVVRSQINLRFLGDPEHFATVYGKPNGADWTTTGFYRIRSNEALILYTPRFRTTALATAFHEMSHLVTAWQLGPTPPWLNEGIAEHFESMQLEWQNSEFPHNRRHLALLRRDGLLPLESLTTLSRREWMSSDLERRYASAWALITFLLDSDRGRLTLQRVLREARSHRCSSGADLQATLRSTYPGGMPALQNEMDRWLERRY